MPTYGRVVFLRNARSMWTSEAAASSNFLISLASSLRSFVCLDNLSSDLSILEIVLSTVREGSSAQAVQ